MKIKGLSSAFGVSADLELDGTWVKIYEAETDGIVPAFKLARANARNEKWASSIVKNNELLKRTGKSKDKDASDRMFRESFCKYVIRDWKDLYDESGPVPFSTEKAIELMKEYPDLLDLLFTRSTEIANFIDEDLDDTVKK